MKEVSQSIGGYFGLEMNRGIEYHESASESLNTGRNCLEYILRSKKYTKIYLPYYMCEVLFEPIRKVNIDYSFYELNEELEPILPEKIGSSEVLLYINYFGLKQRMVEVLSRDKSIQNLIIDNSQAFFASPIQKENIDTFYSARKFFGVSDGAYLYTTRKIQVEEVAKSFDKSLHLLERLDQGAEFGFSHFQKNEEKLIGLPIMRMSNLTKNVMSSIDYDNIILARRRNYKILDEGLSKKNKISLLLETDAVPMVYPYYTDDLNLRIKLIENKVFVAKYWPHIQEWSGTNLMGVNLANHILPIPLDQRYSELEMKKIISLIS